MAELILKTGPRAGERAEVDRELTVGREGTDLVIDDPELSRRHAVVRVVDGGVQVEDLGSTNGTWVDDRRIETPALLSHAATFRIGDTEIEVVAPARDQGTRVAAASAPAGRTVVGKAPPPLVAPAPAPAPDTAPAPAPAPAPPAFAASQGVRHRGAAATRSLSGAVLVSAVVITDAVALIVYFAAR